SIKWKVIAIVTDSLTDLDIFRDLHEACTKGHVPVYILLDQTSVPAFLQMCNNINMRLDDLQHMRVRTLTGSTYYMRSGARINGKVHERFMLIDGNRVATGSYRFNWTDGKLNSSNLIELSGQITEKFDEEFRILYAQSLPINTKVVASVQNSGIYDYQLLKPKSSSSTTAVCKPLWLTSTPNRAHKEREIESIPISGTLTPNGKQTRSDFRHELNAAEENPPNGENADVSPSTLNTDTVTHPAILLCHTSTQTSCLNLDEIMQIKEIAASQDSCATALGSSRTNSPSHSSDSTTSTPKVGFTQEEGQHCPFIHHSAVPTDSNLRDSVSKLIKERHYHFSIIRSKLENMRILMSHRRELVDIAVAHAPTDLIQTQVPILILFI
ncbi:protein FAM83D-like isoform X2, partial [Clarias magur]